MLKILERYLARTIIAATGMTALVIAAVLFIMALLGEFKSFDNDYGFTAALFYVILRMPNDMYQFSPMLILLGSIIALSLLMTHRELAVMRASGFSMSRIIYSVFGAALLMICCISVVGELIGPELSHHAEVQKDNLQNAGQVVVTTEGLWMHVDDNFIHVQRVIGQDLLEGVTRYKFDSEHRLMASYYAKSMTRDDNAQWVMHHVVKTTFLANRTMSEAFPDLNWDLSFNNHLLNSGMADPSELTLPKLVRLSSYLEENGIQSSQYRYEFWSRIFMPLASLVMIFLAIPFVLGALRNAAMGFRLIVGLIAGAAFFIMNSFLGQLCIVYQIPPLFAALTPIIVFAVFGLFLAKTVITT